jgi:sulfate adenylyltransferase
MDRTLDERELCDLECLSIGAFSPLNTYMTQEQYESCLNSNRIPTDSGMKVFPIPITLTMVTSVEQNTEITLKTITNAPVATLTVTECWKPDMNKEWVSVFGTNDSNHPYIKYSMGKGDCYYISGKLSMNSYYKFHSSFTKERLTPQEAQANGPWIGFQTRNPLHRSHIELIRRAASSHPNLKILLHPVEGVTQECDIPFPVRMKCYRQVLPHLPNTSVSILPLSMRMAGPREAVWHAVIRKNYGCSHFIVGRDHAGPSYRKQDGTPFYGPFDAQILAQSLETELGIKIIPSEELVYCEDEELYMTVSEAANKQTKQISGTQFRAMLEKGTPVPEWYSYNEVVEPLKDFYQKPRGLCVYFVGLSGSGKSTLAQGLKAALQETHPHREITILDADEIRTNLSKGLGFSREDRSTNVKRIGYVASEIVRHGGIVLVANIAPFEVDRAANKRLIEVWGKYQEVFVNTPLETCEARDVKGLYAAARAGKITQFTGISDPFETPQSAYVLLDKSVEESIKEVQDLIKGTF